MIPAAKGHRWRGVDCTDCGQKAGADDDGVCRPKVSRW